MEADFQDLQRVQDTNFGDNSPFHTFKHHQKTTGNSTIRLTTQPQLPANSQIWNSVRYNVRGGKLTLNRASGTIVIQENSEMFHRFILKTLEGQPPGRVDITIGNHNYPVTIVQGPKNVLQKIGKRETY